MRHVAKLILFSMLFFPVAGWAGVRTLPTPAVSAPVLGDGGMLALGAFLIGAGIVGIARRRSR